MRDLPFKPNVWGLYHSPLSPFFSLPLPPYTKILLEFHSTIELPIFRVKPNSCSQWWSLLLLAPLFPPSPSRITLFHFHLQPTLPTHPTPLIHLFSTHPPPPPPLLSFFFFPFSRFNLLGVVSFRQFPSVISDFGLDSDPFLPFFLSPFPPPSPSLHQMQELWTQAVRSGNQLSNENGTWELLFPLPFSFFLYVGEYEARVVATFYHSVLRSSLLFSFSSFPPPWLKLAFIDISSASWIFLWRRKFTWHSIWFWATCFPPFPPFPPSHNPLTTLGYRDWLP